MDRDRELRRLLKASLDRDNPPPEALVTLLKEAMVIPEEGLPVELDTLVIDDFDALLSISPKYDYLLYGALQWLFSDALLQRVQDFGAARGFAACDQLHASFLFHLPDADHDLQLLEYGLRHGAGRGAAARLVSGDLPALRPRAR